VNTSDITVVFQGAFKAHVPRDGPGFHEIVRRTRRSLPGSPIVLSTWEGADVPASFGIDEVVRSPDPGPLPPLKLTDRKPNNVNRQIVSTRAGMAAVRTPFAVKLRTDTLLEHAGFIDYFDTQARRDGHDRRIVTTAFFTLDASMFERIPYHVSDWFQFGRREILQAYWSAPLMTPDAARYHEHHAHERNSTVFERRFRSRFAVEQHLAAHYARMRGYACPRVLNDTAPDVMRDHERFLARELLILDPWQAGLVFPKYGWINQSTFQRVNNVMHVDWLALSGQPGFDDVEPAQVHRMISDRRRVKRFAYWLFAASRPFHRALFATSASGRFLRRQAMRAFRGMQRVAGIG
jgi:hypothetical protein